MPAVSGSVGHGGRNSPLYMRVISPSLTLHPFYTLALPFQASHGPDDVQRSVFPTFTEKRTRTEYEFPWDNTEHEIPWDKTDHGIPWDNLPGKDVEDVKIHLSLVAKGFNPFVLKLKAGEVEKAKKKGAVVILADENDKVVAVLRS